MQYIALFSRYLLGLVWTVFMGLSQVYAQDALLCCEEILTPCDKLSVNTSPTLDIDAQLKQVDHYQTYGFYQNAFKLLNTIHCQLDASHTSHQIQVLNHLADLSIAQQKTLHAQHCLQAAKYLAERDSPLLAETLNKKGNMWVVHASIPQRQEKCHKQERCDCLQNDKRQASDADEKSNEVLEAYRASLEIAEKANLTQLRAKVLANIANANIKHNDFPTDLEQEYFYKDLDVAYKAAQVLPASSLKTQLLLTLSQLPEKFHQKTFNPIYPMVVYQLLQAGLESAEIVQDKYALSQAYGLMAAFYEFQADSHRISQPEKQRLYQDALTLNRKAVLAANQVHAVVPLQLQKTQSDSQNRLITVPELHYRWHQQQGSVLHKLGDLDTALIHYRRAIENLLYIQKQLRFTGYHEVYSFDEVIKPIYDKLINLSIQKLHSEPNNQIMLQGLVDALEFYKISEYNNYFKLSPCINNRFLNQRVALPTDTVVMYPFVNQKKLYIVLKKSQRLKLIPIHYADRRNPMERLIGDLSGDILDQDTTFKTNAQKLYQLLITPILGFMGTEIKNLIIVPNDSFRIMPFAALHDGNKFLFERYRLATALSIRSIDLTPSKPLNAANTAILLGGLSDERLGFDALPSVDKELREIKQLYPQNAVLNINAMFTHQTLNQDIQQNAFNILHFSTHGKFAKNIEDSFLLTYDGRLELPAFKDLIYNRDKQIPLELITLSACETAVGNPKANLGLAGIALNTGAKSALASLWQVNADSTTLLITEFYKALNQSQSVSKIAALQQAQKIVQQTPNFEHPYYWSGFILIGNWL